MRPGMMSPLSDGPALFRGEGVDGDLVTREDGELGTVRGKGKATETGRWRDEAHGEEPLPFSAR